MKVKLPNLKKFKFKWDKHVPIIIVISAILVLGSLFSYYKISSLQDLVRTITQEKDKNLEELQNIASELEELKNQDQVKSNEELQATISSIEKTYDKAVVVYDDIVEFRSKSKNTAALEKDFAEALSKLSDRDYSGATDTLNSIASRITQEEQKIAASFTIPKNVPQSNAPPGSGYSRQTVNVEGLGNYLVSLVAADIASTRVIVDTAADGDCGNDCPVLSLGDYVSRNGAYAGVNGSYFCPATYASCAGKTNTFDLLVMNHKKTYFNSDNNVYSSNPAVIFGDGYVRFVTAASQWGRDTSPTGVLSNFPLLVFNGQVVFGGDDDPKKGSKGGRSFVADKEGKVYIGIVHSATVAESARVLQALGMRNAMNLDDGGSSALWSGGYKSGPGRSLPNVILFVGK
ncbi:phosphodiester glycosidase family protein [Patescibacteria group bacterium]|nr:phosphodiester glycosidase family protein [Patescibacteria group bacterium]